MVAPSGGEVSVLVVLPTVPTCAAAKTERCQRASAAAAGELAQPGRDGLLVAQRLAPAGGARLARANGVRRPLRTARAGLWSRSRRCRSSGRRTGPVAFIRERHRARRYPTTGGLSTPDGCTTPSL